MTLLRNGLNALLLFFCVCFLAALKMLDFPWLSKPKVFFYNTRVDHNKAMYALHFAGARNSSFQISAF